MLVLKFLVRFVRLLNSETSSAAIALAFALGVFLGLVPTLTLQAFAAMSYTPMLPLFCVYVV